MNENFNIGFFQVGTNFCITYTLTNTDTTLSGSIAQNVTVTLTLPGELSFQTSASVLSQGTLDEVTGIWSVGSILPNTTVTASFCFTVDTDCPHPFTIEFDVTSDVCNCTLSGSYDNAIVDGVACCDFDTCTGAGTIWLNSEQTLGIFAGSGTPEGTVTAIVGSTFHRIDGGAGTSFYVKESGSGNTGWVAK